jgi:putative addiction module CopG family antidote
LTHFRRALIFKRMNVTLPRNLEEYVAELVQTSGYKGSDEVVREALSEHQARRRGVEVVMTPELERLLDEGLENADQGRTTEELRRRR